MKTPFIPTAMRCTREQFEAIKPKLIERGFVINAVFAFKYYPYLANNLMGMNGVISNINSIEDSTVYEEWNEEIFLRNLGGDEIVEKELLQEDYVKPMPTYDRGMMAATIFSGLIQSKNISHEQHLKDAVEYTNRLINQLNK